MSDSNHIINIKPFAWMNKIKQIKIKMNTKDPWRLTGTSFTPDLDAPMQRPVDMAPQPEYRSNKVISDLLDWPFWDSPVATIASPIALLDPVSLEIDDLSFSAVDFSALSKWAIQIKLVKFRFQ